MSSRRTVGEDNILAMLERDSARRSGTRASNLRLACYGAAAAFAGILAGGVAWLAYDNHKSAADLQAGHDALVMVPPVVSNASPPPGATAPMLPPPAAEAPRAAVIVDEPEPAPRTASNAPAAVPPLVMLPPQEAAPARTATKTAMQPAPRVARSSALPPLVMLPRHEAAPARTVTPAPAPAPRLRKNAASTSPAKPRTTQLAARGSERNADKKSDKAPRPAARAAKPAPTRSVAKAAASDTARQRKAAATAPQVDSDVALISAIIAQSERHRGEREAAAACSGTKCPSKPAQP
ncbi:hypothetical protein [Massilia sp. SYSU DXS3249]